ncbi:MAG: type II toxin-antitoxin system RelE/ParE family toxin [Kofleriaceae bacterium]|nr:type II toxin-antitoxin system RelE/ParE family toxin [Kofleriaceae bacterium]
MTLVVFTDRAERELREVLSWWRVNRPEARNRVDEEIERCIALLTSAPNAGPRVRTRGALPFRRLAMRRTRHTSCTTCTTRKPRLFTSARSGELRDVDRPS